MIRLKAIIELGFVTCDFHVFIAKANLHYLRLYFTIVLPSLSQSIPCISGGCSLGRRVYVAGGFTGEECVFSVECFDVDSDQWTRVPRMAVARSGVSVVAYRGRVVVLGGYDGHNRLKSVEVYDPDANQWKMLKPMLTKR